MLSFESRGYTENMYGMQTIWYNFDNPHSDVTHFQLVSLALLLGLFCCCLGFWVVLLGFFFSREGYFD